MEEPTTEKKSEFNEQQFKMLRLHQIQNGANEAQINRDFPKWFDCLTSLYKELIGKLTADEKDVCVKIIQRVSIRLENFNSAAECYNGLYNQNTDGTFRNLKSELFAFDCKLRELSDKHGFSGRDESEEMF